MGLNHHLTDFENGVIVGSRRAGLSVAKMAELLRKGGNLKDVQRKEQNTRHFNTFAMWGTSGGLGVNAQCTALVDEAFKQTTRQILLFTSIRKAVWSDRSPLELYHHGRLRV